LIAASADTAYADKGTRLEKCISFFFAPSDAVAKWGKKKVKTAQDFMEKIFLSTDGKIKGATKAAALDPRGEYNGLWIRDNGINAREVMNNPEVEEAYISFCKRNLATHTLGGLGEPKFNADGTAFNEPWGRPQNDGPAYRALRWMEYIEKKLKLGNRGLALENYSPDLNHLSVKWDLEYIAHHWRDPSFDLWEEEMGSHFHTITIMLDAMEKGAALAAKLEPEGLDSGAVKFYLEQARQMRETLLAAAWDPHRGYLRSTWHHAGGFVHKQEPLDIGVILALLHTTTKPPVFKFGDEKVLATMAALEERFTEIYRFNRQWSDPRYRGVAALGRYAEDVFHGGNPWVIATQGGAEYYFRLGAELLGSDEIVITATNQKFFSRLMNGSGDFRVGRRIAKGTQPFNDIVSAVQEKGDGFLEIIRSVTKEDGFHAEQIARGYEPGDQGPWVANYLKEALGGDGSRTDGGGQWLGAQLLVWNEASFRSTWRARNEFLAKRRNSLR
jgi:glucoamylase